MLREGFDKRISGLKDKVFQMGNMVDSLISESMEALLNQDLEAAAQIEKKDDKIDKLEMEIEGECMNLLTLQQPLAGDLRLIAAALKIITDLERMGDHAVNVAHVTLEIGKEPFIKPLIDIPKMADYCRNMIEESLDAFENADVEKAKKVAEMDEEVDKLYDRVFEDVINIIADNRELLKQGSKLLFIARYLERIADHTTNICERIIYMVTGVYKEIN